MEALELLDIIAAGETSRVQFKEIVNSQDQLTAEMVAFSNSRGGRILVGVKDRTGEILGLSSDEIRSISSLAANVASNNLKPPIFIYTEVVSIETRKILVIEIAEGMDKPYFDKSGVVWVKNGPDKRRVIDNNEMARLMAQGGNLSADEMPIKSAGSTDLDQEKVFGYCRRLDEDFNPSTLDDFGRLLENLNLAKGGDINLAGLLLFGRDPQKFKPAFCIKAVSYFGDDIAGTRYRSSKDITGDIATLYSHATDFLRTNLNYIQTAEGFNQPGVLEISPIAIEELLVNALVHRDYFKNASIRLLVLDSRVEIISPGRLPNALTVENIKTGNAVIRNPIIASVASRVLPYRGLGSGILRAIKAHPGIEFINDETGEQFIVKIPRKKQ